MLERLLRLARVVIQPSHAAADGDRGRVEVDRYPALRERRLAPPHRDQKPGMPLPGHGVAGVELERTVEFAAGRRPIPVEDERHPPERRVRFSEGLVEGERAAGFDLGVRSLDLVPTDAIAIPLGRIRRMAVVGSPAFFESRTTPQTPSELLGHPCVRVRLPNGSLFRWRFEKSGEELHLDVEGPITLDEASLARIAVENGVGIGYFMETDVREDLADGRLVRILEDWTPPLAPVRRVCSSAATFSQSSITRFRRLSPAFSCST